MGRNKDKRGVLLILSGASGSGKDSVMEGVINERDSFSQIVTYTSREIREGEKHGVDYHFVTRKEFEEMKDRREFIEHVLYGSDYKGTHKSSLEKVLKGENVIWRIDMSRAAGAEELIMEKFEKDVADKLRERTAIVLLDCEEDVLYERIEERDGGDYDKEEYKKRMIQDMEVRRNNEFQHVVPNKTGKLEETIGNVVAIVDAVLRG